MRIHLPLALWFLALLAPQQPPPAPPASPVPATRLQTKWAAQVTPDRVPSGALTAPHLRVFHDDDARVYLNGVLVAEIPGANAGFAYVPLTGAARAALKSGRNVLAVHAHQNRGGQFIDVGLVDVIEQGPPR